MILLNFSHPLKESQREQIEKLAGRAISRVIETPPHFDEQEPFLPQMEALMAGIPLSPTQWQTEPILILLPSLNFIAGLLLAELHGRMGYFPPVVRTRPVSGAVPRRYEVAEILDLQATRDAARRRR